MDTAQQREAMRFCMNTEEVLGDEAEDADAESDEEEGEEMVEAEDFSDRFLL